MDEGLTDGQVVYVSFFLFFSRKGNQLAIPESLNKTFSGPQQDKHAMSEEPDEFPSFYLMQKFIPIQNEIIQIHTYGKDPSCLLNETNFQQKGPKTNWS